MNVDKIKALFALCGALLSTQSLAVTISSDGQRMEETLSLSANIDLSEEALLGTVDIKPMTPTTELAIWNKDKTSFNDLGLLVRVERLAASPLQVTVLRDDYNCTFGKSIVSNTGNKELFSQPNYIYSLRSTGALFKNGKHQIGIDDWNKIEDGKYISDLDINIGLPQLKKSEYEKLNATQGHCTGSTLFLFTLF